MGNGSRQLLKYQCSVQPHRQSFVPMNMLMDLTPRALA